LPAHVVNNFQFPIKLTDAGISTPPYNTKFVPTRDSLDGNGTLSLGAEADTFTDKRKLVFSLTSPLALLYATSLKKITSHPMPGLISPLFQRVCRIPTPSPEEVEIVPNKPILNTSATINRTDLASQAAADAA
jgi:hypothetical protein